MSPKDPESGARLSPQYHSLLAALVEAIAVTKPFPQDPRLCTKTCDASSLGAGLARCSSRRCYNRRPSCGPCNPSPCPSCRPSPSLGPSCRPAPAPVISAAPPASPDSPSDVEMSSSRDSDSDDPSPRTIRGRLSRQQARARRLAARSDDNDDNIPAPRLAIAPQTPRQTAAPPVSLGPLRMVVFVHRPMIRVAPR